MSTIPQPIQQAYGNRLPKEGMNYEAQVVWCLDSGDSKLMYSAQCIHGKRVAAGEGEKSAVVCGRQPKWPEGLRETDNVRLVVVAHGVRDFFPNRIKICVRTNQRVEDANVPVDAVAAIAAIRNRAGLCFQGGNGRNMGWSQPSLFDQNT